MKLEELMANLNVGLMGAAAPVCSGWERIGLGIGLAAVTYRVGQLVKDNTKLLMDWGAMDAEGNLNADMVEQCIVNGIPFPLCVGNLKFEKSDFEKIFANMKGN